MATRFISVRLNQQSLEMLYTKNNRPVGMHNNSKRERSDSLNSSAQDGGGVPVEYSYEDTFTTLMEKCLVALNIRGNDSSSTNFSNEDQASWSRNSVTKQALLYDKEHGLVTMLQEVKESEHYFLEIIDSKLMAMNQLSSSPMLPPSLERQDSSDRGGGSFNNSSFTQQSRKSSLAQNKQCADRYSSFASGARQQSAARRDSRGLSVDTEDMDQRTRSDLGYLEAFGKRQTKFKVALVGQQQSGKTSLAYRFVDRTSFLDDYEPTLIDTYEQEMNMIDPNDGLNRVVNLTIVDIGHQVLKEQMLQDCDAVLFCYDVTSEESFFALSSLFQLKMQMEYSSVLNGNNDEESGDMIGGMPAAMATLNLQSAGVTPGQPQATKSEPKLRPVVLVGCKSDLQGDRQVDYLDGERTAESFKAPYIECSASTNYRVEDVFELVLIQLFKQEKAERDSQVAEQTKQKMLSGGIYNDRHMMKRGQDESCCTIF